MLRTALAGLLSMVVCSLAEPTRGREPELAPPPRRILNQVDEFPHIFMGRVAAMTGQTITLKPEGYIKFTTQLSTGEAYELVSVYKQDNTKPPRTFVFHRDLLRGIVERRHHKIADVQPGDVVWIDCRRLEGVDFCIEIEIWRRPGGRVPPAFGDNVESPKLRVDNFRNAEQAQEEMLIATFRRLKGLAR